MRPPKQFFVYIMTNGPRPAVLYTGITGNLPHRVWQHKHKLISGFTSRYNLTCLVYYESFFYPDAAIDREKEIKGWRRSKKIKLIESINPRWDDLAKDWQNVYKPGPKAHQREIPRPAGENAGLRDDAEVRVSRIDCEQTCCVILSAAVLQAERRISRATVPPDSIWSSDELVGLLKAQVAETHMRTKALLGVSAFVVIWTLIVHLPRHWNPTLAYPLYFGLAAHSFVVGQHQTLTWDKIGFVAELAANLALYLAAALAVSRFKSSRIADKTGPFPIE